MHHYSQIIIAYTDQLEDLLTRSQATVTLGLSKHLMAIYQAAFKD